MQANITIGPRSGGTSSLRIAWTDSSNYLEAEVSHAATGATFKMRSIISGSSTDLVSETLSFDTTGEEMTIWICYVSGYGQGFMSANVSNTNGAFHGHADDFYSSSGSPGRYSEMVFSAATDVSQFTMRHRGQGCGGCSVSLNCLSCETNFEGVNVIIPEGVAATGYTDTVKGTYALLPVLDRADAGHCRWANTFDIVHPHDEETGSAVIQFDLEVEPLHSEEWWSVGGVGTLPSVSTGGGSHACNLVSNRIPSEDESGFCRWGGSSCDGGVLDPFSGSGTLPLPPGAHTFTGEMQWNDDEEHDEPQYEIITYPTDQPQLEIITDA